MFLKKALGLVGIVIGISSLVYSNAVFSCEQAKSKVQTTTQKQPPKVRPLARNPYRADGSTVGCKLVVPYDAYFKQPVYSCPMPTKLQPNSTRWLLADGSKYYKP